MRTCRSAILVCLAGILLAATACAPPVDLGKNLKVVDAATGWFDLGVINGQTKLVPMVTFKLKNESNQSLPVLQMNVLFHRIGYEKVEWGSGFVSVTGSSGLAPGATTETLTVKSNLGYTGSDQTRQEMMASKVFVDATVQLFAKYSSVAWVKVAELPVTRRLVNY